MKKFALDVLVTVLAAGLVFFGCMAVCAVEGIRGLRFLLNAED